MSVPFSGTIGRSRGIVDAIHKQLRLLNLKPVGRIAIKFDPFGSKASETRNFLFHITLPKVRETNPECVIKTEILSDRSDPNVEFKLRNGEKVIFKAGNLTTLELLQLYNKHITPLAPPPEEASIAIVTKASKTKGSRRK
ncbi:hypothetical protein R5R35_011141 [Gryllus longicercus]|uniref:Large ribosomal subunit protein mL53 n=1 Tax=Gryllus longicercus TaxID=2509291 RepID=A0AAN9VKU7_9ORTH